ncbi:MAG: hypothetical protein Q4F40_08145 [Akkermansia sp.]|nr:hypothetical protein [Akkermansia sp.]
MSVTPTPGKGVQVNLNEYARLKTSRTGPDFWYIDNQSLLCDKLKPFLPNMRYNEAGNQVTASLVSNAKERLGDSIAANPDFSNVPAEQVRMLRNVIIFFLQEISEQPTGSPIGRLGDAFKLPIPSKAPELYRIYGTGKNKKLAIIWGVSKIDSSGNEDTNSVASLKEMLHILPNPRKENPVIMFISTIIECISKLPRNVRLALLGILVILIAVLSWMSCNSGDDNGTCQQPGMTQQPGNGMTPPKNLSVDNLPCEISVEKIEQMRNRKIHITFKVTPRNGQMPHKVFIAGQEVKNGGITLAYNRTPKRITVSVIPSEGADPIEAKLTIREN